MNNFLIFTGVGNVSDDYLSWAKEPSNIYDRAINYYKENNNQNLTVEYTFKNKGMIWENFVKNYHMFKNYKYVLIVDSDIKLNPKQIEETFLMAESNNWPACQWSRDPKSFGYYVEKYKQNTNTEVRKTNFIEMNFMMIRKDVLEDLVLEWNTLNLKWSTGIDLILSNLALTKNYLPFYILDRYTFYNPWPNEKSKGREIDGVTETDTKNRLKPVLDIMNKNPQKYKINPYNVTVVTRNTQ